MMTSAVGLFVFLQTLLGYIHAQDATVTFSLREELPAKTFVGSVALESHLFEDFSNERFQQLQFQILTNTGNRFAQLFTIEQNTSILWTKVVLDRESFGECILECLLDFNVAVYDLAGIDSPKLIQVLLNLLDVNDNVPTFETKNITLGVAESLPTGSEVLISAAEDLDKGQNNFIQTYRLSPDSDIFELQNVDNSGYKEFVIKLKSTLDRETVKFHEFTILAIDGGSQKLTGTLTVYIHVLDTNDNFPEFVQDSYSSIIEENASVNSTVALVYAKDRDSGDNGKVSYKFKDSVSDKVRKLLHINDTTGEITVAGVIDYEQNHEVNFTVQACDHGNPSKTADVEIHVKILDQNDNYPQININQPPSGFLLPESSENGTFVAHVAVSDEDSGDFGFVICQILDDHFRLESAGMKDNYKIVVNKALDHETHSSHLVNVTCMDGGRPPKQNSTNFVVHVDDENDNKPEFTQAIYKGSIEENNKIGATVLGVMATDLDSGKYGQIRYAIHPEVGHLFAIDVFTGIITATDTLDREKHGPELVFRVIATDQGDPQHTTLGSVVLKILDQNDNDPVFTTDPVKFYIVENEPKGTRLGNISASDPDYGENGTVMLSFPTDPKVLELFSFELLEDNFVTVILEKPLDRDVQAFHEFTVKAMDLGGRTSSAVVVVYVSDLNDNSPEIVYPRPPDNKRLIPYSLEKDSVVFKVDARDADFGNNSELLYEIEQDNSSYSFNINKNTGQVFLNNTLKREDVGSVFGLVIRVSDKGNPPQSSWETISLHIVEGDVEPVTAAAQISIWIVIVLVVVTVVLSVIMLAGIIKICLFNRNKFNSNSSDIIIESGKVDTKLIDSSSSSSSSSTSSSKELSGNSKNSLGSGLKGQLDENGSIHNTTFSSIDRQFGDEVYLQQVRDVSTCLMMLLIQWIRNLFKFYCLSHIYMVILHYIELSPITENIDCLPSCFTEELFKAYSWT